jgi:hypothetical protein
LTLLAVVETFLVITYRELRLLELEILRTLNKSGQRVLDVSKLFGLTLTNFMALNMKNFLHVLPKLQCG